MLTADDHISHLAIERVPFRNNGPQSVFGILGLQ